jgi:isopenicillin N synthase-like dioxygenase
LPTTYGCEMSATLPIDIVDLESPTARRDLGFALESTGFVQLVGHGLDPHVRRDFRESSDVFFGLPTEVKERYVHPEPAANRGYRANGSEALSYSLGEASPPDLFESFNSAPAPTSVHELRQPTPWPDHVVPGFSRVATRSYAAMGDLAATLDQLLGRELGVDWLAERSTSGPDMLATINYRPGPDGTEPHVDGQQRMGAHSDYTTFTILDADPVPGLQIVSPSGEWVDVVPEPGALLMNVGDLLAILTNDRWPSTLHRVIPMAEGGAAVRRSVAYFHYPDLEVDIAPLQAEVGRTGHANYEHVTVEAHLLGKLTAPKTHEPATGASTIAGRMDLGQP